MISKLIEESELWDKENLLPTIPIHNNPRIYTALAFKFVKASGEKIPFQWWSKYWKFAGLCFQYRNGNRFVSRWPGGRGGNFSHDEILGDAYLYHLSAGIHLSILEGNHGIYPDSEGKIKLSRWFYRFLFLRPFLKARWYGQLSWWDGLQWCVPVWLQVWKTRRNNFDSDGIFKVWLMLETMVAHCPKTCEAWLARMDREGITPKLLFQDYLKEVSMADYAPESFRKGL